MADFNWGASTPASSNTDFFNTPASAPASDPFATPAPASDPFAAPAPAPTSDPFAAPAPTSDPFAAPAPTSDPFAAPAPASDPFAAPAPASDPFAAPAPGSDPFAAPAPASDPFAAPAPASDPFAAPATSSSNDIFSTPAATPAAPVQIDEKILSLSLSDMAKEADPKNTQTTQARRVKLVALVHGIEQLFKILNLNEDIAKTIARKNDGLKDKSDKYHKNLEYMKKVTVEFSNSVEQTARVIGQRASDQTKIKNATNLNPDSLHASVEQLRRDLTRVDYELDTKKINAVPIIQAQLTQLKRQQTKTVKKLHSIEELLQPRSSESKFSAAELKSVMETQLEVFTNISAHVAALKDKVALYRDKVLKKNRGDNSVGSDIFADADKREAQRGKVVIEEMKRWDEKASNTMDALKKPRPATKGPQNTSTAPAAADPFGFSAPAPSSNDPFGFSTPAPAPSSNDPFGFSTPAPAPSSNDPFGVSTPAPAPSTNDPFATPAPSKPPSWDFGATKPTTSSSGTGFSFF